MGPTAAISALRIGSGGIHDAMKQWLLSRGAVGISRDVPALARDASFLGRAPRGVHFSWTLGAGKGARLLLAAELPFRKVLGVELNEALARIALRNVTLWKRIARLERKIRVMHEDAAEFRWPRTPLLVYLNNPFDCALVELLVSQIAAAAASGPGLVDLLYVNPACADALTSHEPSSCCGRANPKWTRLTSAQTRMAQLPTVYRHSDIARNFPKS